jgi:imidazolonepropionase-like amidohydrolase
MSRVLIRDACLADGMSASLQVEVSLLIKDGRIAGIDTDDVDPAGAEVLDGGGATIVPAFVDAHSHLTMPGGSHWIERGSDPPDALREVARRNAARLVSGGILWARDVGAPAGADGRAISLDVRAELRERVEAPHVQVAGTWIAKEGYLPLTVAVSDGAGLEAAALAQLDAGADFVKIMLDPPGGSAQSPFSVDEVKGVVRAVHGRGRRITAHATILDGARVGAEAGVDSIEHGMELDDDVAMTMKRNDVALVSTLSVLASWRSFENTTRIERFISDEGKRKLAARRERAVAAVQSAYRAGVRIAAGSDFGGGSLRAGHLAWEVEQLVEAGLEPHEALAAATWRGGELLGIGHAGRLRPGDPADLVLVHGDPLSDPRALWRVWAVFKAGTRII